MKSSSPYKHLNFLDEEKKRELQIESKLLNAKPPNTTSKKNSESLHETVGNLSVDNSAAVSKLQGNRNFLSFQEQALIKNQE